MRKNLLASAAALGAPLMPGLASAQMATIPNLLGGASAPNGTSDYPTAGSVVVRLGGAMDWYAVGASDSGDRSTAFGPGGANPTVVGRNAATNNFKQATYTFGDYIRLYPTVDGVAANGLRYGVYWEIRIENFLAPVAAPTLAFPPRTASTASTFGALTFTSAYGTPATSTSAPATAPVACSTPAPSRTSTRAAGTATYPT